MERVESASALLQIKDAANSRFFVNALEPTTSCFSGSMNMMGNLAGFAAPVFGGYILERTGGDWNVFLYTMAAIYLVGVICWPFIDPVTPMEVEHVS